ncbi:pentatricopeptide repeat-containing protein At2g13600 isoform X2 [Cryptomeria japonica]|uniref:pentatricopeptide repeat-containing protein At2g13600 isoform X2 n=1 Tax=Cryptomeria japonica TaxID=3369 RepID=UPI0027DA6107|nr:pentatricopeptide repeat-containing protein At2g13600 isoform X2 [Cryptomeria japonica]
MRVPSTANLNVTTLGKQFHSVITHRGFAFVTHTYMQNNLINMYVKCGGLMDARKVFDDMTKPDNFSWNAMIAAYRKHGYPHEALKLFHQMQLIGFRPDQFAFASVLPACAKIKDLEQGMDIHESVTERGFLSDLVVANALVDMYGKCGSIRKARELFNKMPQKNVVSWNAMIAGYAQNGALDEALHLFKAMPQRNVVSWNAVVAACAQNGQVGKALGTFKQMQLAGLKSNSTTFISILPACARMGALELGMNIHQIIIECGFLSDVLVVNALIDMYAKCGSMKKAYELFVKMPQRDVVSWTAMIGGYAQNGVLGEALRLFKEMPQPDVIAWNTMIAGYAQNGFVEKALEAFKQMQLTGVKPDSTTFISVLPACAKMGALDLGIDIHQSIIECGFLSDVVVVNALIDMYAKCGSIRKARELFDKMLQRDVVSWTAMIAGCAQNGFCKDALKLFEQMKHSETCPDHKWVCGMRFKWQGD